MNLNKDFNPAAYATGSSFHSGMTMLEDFAKAALPAVINRYAARFAVVESLDDLPTGIIASQTWEIATAMMQERQLYVKAETEEAKRKTIIWQKEEAERHRTNQKQKKAEESK